MQGPHAIYTERREARLAAVRGLARRHARLANARLAVFLAGLGLAGTVFSSWAVSPWLLVVPFVGYVLLAVRHERVRRNLRQMEQAVRFFDLGLARLENRWAGQGESGTRFLQPEHPYATDLDLFGPGSLFELLCTCRTHLGEETLAQWLLAPANAKEVSARQAAVSELKNELDFRELLALVGSRMEAKVNSQDLARWGEEAPVLPWDWHRLLLDASVLATVSAGVLWSMAIAPLSLIFLAVLAQMAYVAWMARPVRRVLSQVESKAQELALLAELLAALEARTWNAPKLQSLRAALGSDRDSAAQAIASLSLLLDRLAWRHNAMFLPLAALLLWGTRQAYAIDAWRQRHGRPLSAWLRAVGEFEALSALASYSFEHPEEPFPEVVEGGSGGLFDGVGLKHPLMDRAKCVPNSVRLDAARPLLIVSGSNMSGKSTLLRVVGIHVVMALAGAATPCQKLKLCVLNLGATLRIQDSLQEGRSRFYAEILRLRQIVELASLPKVPLLFLLDEILHGTNSHDRRLGAAGVIQGLLQRGALGLVTTHDLALADLAAELGGRAENVHFADRLDGGTLEFDYQMRPGVVRHSNALALMRAVGLEV